MPGGLLMALDLRAPSFSSLAHLVKDVELEPWKVYLEEDPAGAYLFS